ncbi:hypothetical protein B0H14DRAFT_440905 [Mycena olivaceomarginata]|nr:hypothetical protein B0H14DRAFT_440905 [Mycena olivaceomarginata]
MFRRILTNDTLAGQHRKQLPLRALHRALLRLRPHPAHDPPPHRFPPTASCTPSSSTSATPSPSSPPSATRPPRTATPPPATPRARAKPPPTRASSARPSASRPCASSRGSSPCPAPRPSPRRRPGASASGTPSAASTRRRCGTRTGAWSTRRRRCTATRTTGPCPRPRTSCRSRRTSRTRTRTRRRTAPPCTPRPRVNDAHSPPSDGIAYAEYTRANPYSSPQQYAAFGNGQSQTQNQTRHRNVRSDTTLGTTPQTYTSSRFDSNETSTPNTEAEGSVSGSDPFRFDVALDTGMSGKAAAYRAQQRQQSSDGELEYAEEEEQYSFPQEGQGVPEEVLLDDGPHLDYKGHMHNASVGTRTSAALL